MSVFFHYFSGITLCLFVTLFSIVLARYISFGAVILAIAMGVFDFSRANHI